MSREAQVRFCERLGVKFPWSTLPIVHCRTEAEARQIVREIGNRLSACGLTLHSEKTKIVYCRDKDRPGQYPDVQFDFLGYTFRPRYAKSRWGNLFLSFLPAVSTQASKKMCSVMRSWKIHRWTQLTIEELAKSFNPVLRGWIGYYGQFYRSKLASIFTQLDYALARWARRKYKRLKCSQTLARHWVKRIAQQNPGLFAHWQITFAGMTER
jgi:RNA-directed DNA polymerase